MILRTIKRALRPIVLRASKKLIMVAARDIDIARARIAAEESAAYLISAAPMARAFKDKFELLDFSLDKVKIPGLYCEFGVFEGATINHIAGRSQARVYGFDSFEGLPEDWRAGFETSRFKVSRLPRVSPNVTLCKGWFDQSLPEFLELHTEQIAFLHIDCDLYSSTRTVLELLTPRIRPGTVIQFDEFFNYPGWTGGEHKAFKEFCAGRGAVIEHLGYVSGDEQFSVRILDIDMGSTGARCQPDDTSDYIGSLVAVNGRGRESQIPKTPGSTVQTVKP